MAAAAGWLGWCWEVCCVWVGGGMAAGLTWRAVAAAVALCVVTPCLLHAWLLLMWGMAVRALHPYCCAHPPFPPRRWPSGLLGMLCIPPRSLSGHMAWGAQLH